MKKIKFFSFASAVLLASAAGMTSCSSDSIEPTGGSGVAGQVVKTQFVINIPYAGNESGGNARVSTRMTAENTQNNNKFLGLKDIEMFAYDNVPSESNPTSTRTIRIGTHSPSSSDNYRRIYSDIAIPVGTNNLILYARAPKVTTGATSTNKSDFQAGYLTNPYEKFTDEAKPNLSELNFSLEAIHKNNDFNEKGQAILERLNTIAKTKTSDGQKWSEIGTEESANNDDKILHTLYNTFTKLTAGSANSVNSFIKHLKAAIKSQGVKTKMADAIIANCVEVSGDFPRGLFLPDGVVRVTFDNTTNGFTFVTATAGTPPTSSDLIDYKTVTYPSELAYFVSSPIKTSTTDKSKATDLPKYDDWLAGTETWEGYKDIVQNNTRFVALQNPVQYGVACLKSSIKYSGTSLEDNAKEKIGSESNNFITVNDNSFPITGILIGGQPAGVKWDFEPNSATKPADFKYTIYDSDMNGGINFTAKTEGTGTLPYNYTLVLDNKDISSENADQSNVNVVIELENKAADFYGADGLIPEGSKFYLAGTLDLNATNSVKPNDSKVDHVFVKDHTTVANFTIKDLKKAYNCIPDLRTSKINVGLAVDLSWKEGITFEVEI